MLQKHIKTHTNKQTYKKTQAI